MMKGLKYAVACSAVFVLIGASMTVAAETITDPTGDVWHWTYNGTTYAWAGNVGDKPNIDITQVSATVSENDLTLSLTVAGTIQTSSKVGYWAYYNTTDSSYSMYWYNGTGVGIASNRSGGYDFVQNLTVSGNKISAVFSLLGSTTTSDLWGWAAEFTAPLGTNQNASEWWGDWAPNSKIPFNTNPGGGTGNNTGGNTGNNTGGNTGNNSGGKKGTPGFEIVPVVAAVAIAIILMRRRR